MDANKRIDLLAISGIAGMIGSLLIVKMVQITNKRIDLVVDTQRKLNDLQMKINELDERDFQKINAKLDYVTAEMETLKG